MGCNFTMRCLVLLLFLLTVVKADEKAFVVANLTTDFECEVLPKSSFCPSDINVHVGQISVFKKVITIVNQTKNIIPNVNASCFDAVKNYTCLAIPRCEPERIYVDIDAVIAVCEKGKKVCPQLLVSILFNCTSKKEQFKIYPISAYMVKCKNIQDGSGFCPKVQYKLAEIPGVNFTDVFNRLKMNVEMIKPNVTDDCYAKVKETACTFSTIACTDNEKYGVALISKQECKERIKCLPQQLYANINKGCDGLPDEKTAKQVPLPSGAGGNPTVNPSVKPSINPYDKPSVKPTGSYIQPTSSVNQTAGVNPNGNTPSDGSSVTKAVYNMVAISLISLLFL